MRQGTKWQMFAVGVLLAGVGGTTWAGDSIRPIHDCGRVEAEAQSSFVLVTNLFSQGDCLKIVSRNVTIDLNGFRIVGNGTGRGISADDSWLSSVTVRNGTIKGFETGIALAGSGNIIENVRVEENTDTGMVLGASSVVSQAVAQANGRSGIRLSTGSTIKDSVLNSNGNAPDSVGLWAAPGCTVTGNSIWKTIGTGLGASVGTTLVNNTVLDTSPGIGISVHCPSNVIQNTATNNVNGNLQLIGDNCNTANNVAP